VFQVQYGFSYGLDVQALTLSHPLQREADIWLFLLIKSAVC